MARSKRERAAHATVLVLIVINAGIRKGLSAWASLAQMCSPRSTLHEFSWQLQEWEWLPDVAACESRSDTIADAVKINSLNGLTPLSL